MHRNLIAGAVLASALLGSTSAQAAPGLGGEVYGATVEPGEVEIELRSGVLTGGPDAGESVVKAELGYGITGHTRIATVVEFEKEPGSPRRLEAIAFEVVQNVGRIGPVDVALYGEYEIVRGGSDEGEAKLLLEYRGRALDLRFNLIAGKELANSNKVELGYAASADYAVSDSTRVGVAAFGGLGTFSNFAPRAAHFVGPNFKFHTAAFGRPFKIETGYLFALGAAKDDAKGMVRLNLELEL